MYFPLRPMGRRERETLAASWSNGGMELDRLPSVLSKKVYTPDNTLWRAAKAAYDFLLDRPLSPETYDI